MSTRSLGILAGIGIVSFISLTLNQNWRMRKPYAQVVANPSHTTVALDSHTHTIKPNSDLSESITSPSSKSTLIVDLNLTKAQKRQIDQIRRQYQPQISQLKSDLSIAQKQLSEMIYGTETVESIRLQQQQVVQLRAEIEALRFESILQMREVLSTAQRTQLGQILSDRQNQISTDQNQSVNTQP